MTIKPETEHNIRLTSAEMASLWASYTSDSMAIQVLKYFLEKVEDSQIKPVIEYALEIAQSHVQKVTHILSHENFPIPQGFTDDDANPTAPRLFSDPFFLHYIKQMARVGLNSNSMALALSARSDIIDFYSECLVETKDLNNRATNILLSKGLYVRPPYLSTTDKVEFVQKQGFLDGLFGEHRTLLAVEITHLYANILMNMFGKALSTGFSQVSNSQDVRKYMVRGKEIAAKHIEVMGSIMIRDDIPVPMTWDSDVMDSTIAPFSDKLMMFHVSALNSIGISDYGSSVSVSMRKDLITTYTRLAAEVGLYTDDGAKLMIDNNWMEQPPKAPDRKALAGV